MCKLPQSSSSLPNEHGAQVEGQGPTSLARAAQALQPLFGAKPPAVKVRVSNHIRVGGQPFVSMLQSSCDVVTTQTNAGFGPRRIEAGFATAQSFVIMVEVEMNLVQSVKHVKKLILASFLATLPSCIFAYVFSFSTRKAKFNYWDSAPKLRFSMIACSAILILASLFSFVCVDRGSNIGARIAKLLWSLYF